MPAERGECSRWLHPWSSPSSSFFRNIHFSWTLQFISQYWLHLWFLVLRPRFPSYQDWADVATYTLVFLWGAIFFSDRRFEEAIRRQVRWLLATGTLAIVGIGLLTYFTSIHAAGDAGANLPAQLAQSFLWSLFVWSWLLAILYLGIRWLNFPNRILRYAEESVLPVYVIHHPVVLLVASFVVTWNLGVWPKFAVILVMVAVLTIGIYEFGVRRSRATRLMFGLNPVALASIESSQSASHPHIRQSTPV